jgi:hypothetical protein
MTQGRPRTSAPLNFAEIIAGWSSPVARQAHNLKVVGSNPTPATKSKAPPGSPVRGFLLASSVWQKDLLLQNLIHWRQSEVCKSLFLHRSGRRIRPNPGRRRWPVLRSVDPRVSCGCVARAPVLQQVISAADFRGRSSDLELLLVGKINQAVAPRTRAAIEWEHADAGTEAQSLTTTACREPVAYTAPLDPWDNP